MATKAEKEAFEARQARMREIKGVTKEQRQKQKDKTIQQSRILADLGLLALSALPAGAVIRGGQLIYRGLKGAKAMAAVRKALAASKKADKSRKDYKPATTTKPKAESKPATTTKKPKEQPKKLTQQPKKIPKKQPGTAVATRSASKPQTTTQRKPMKQADVTATATRTPKKVTGPAKPAPKPKKTLTKKQKAAIAAAVITGGAAVTKIATTKKPAEAVPTPKRGVTGDMSDRQKQRQVTKVAKKPKPTTDRNKDGLKKRTTPPLGGVSDKRTSISAGPNTGFGPKGNIFPSGRTKAEKTASRKRLMDKYGGTGSAAAKAAAAGTQGNLKKKKKS